MKTTYIPSNSALIKHPAKSMLGNIYTTWQSCIKFYCNLFKTVQALSSIKSHIPWNMLCQMENNSAHCKSCLIQFWKGSCISNFTVMYPKDCGSTFLQKLFDTNQQSLELIYMCQPGAGWSVSLCITKFSKEQSTWTVFKGLQWTFIHKINIQGRCARCFLTSEFTMKRIMYLGLECEYSGDI